MSALIRCQSNIKHKKHLLSALKLMGIPQEFIKVAPSNTLTLHGYGSQSAKVEILITKNYHEGYGDIGFAKTPEGKYEILVDDLDDIGRLRVRANVKIKFSNKVKQWYAASVTKATLKNQGFFPQIKDEGTRIKVLATG